MSLAPLTLRKLAEQGQRALGLFRIDPADRMTDMDDHEVAHLHTRCQNDRYFLADATQIHQRLSMRPDLDQLRRNG